MPRLIQSKIIVNALIRPGPRNVFGRTMAVLRPSLLLAMNIRSASTRELRYVSIAVMPACGSSGCT